MNDDSNNLHPWIEPELEARLTALVLGEASDFERDELERLIADRPELGLYRKRLEVMHRMLHEVASGESADGQGEWKLSGERREVVLARLSGELGPVERELVQPEKRSPWSISSRFLAIAATVMIAGLLLGMLFPASTGILRSSASSREVVIGWESSHPVNAQVVADRKETEMVLDDQGIPDSSSKLSADGSAQSDRTGIRVGGDFDARPMSGTPFRGSHSNLFVEGTNTSSGISITGGGVLATTDPEPAADAPAPMASVTRGNRIDDFAAAELPKVMTTADEKPLMESEKLKSDLTGNLVPGQSGFAAAPAATPAPAAPASPMSITASSASGSVVSEPVVEQQLMKRKEGSLALDTEVTEFDGFIDRVQANVVPTTSPAFVAEEGDFLRSPVGANLVRDTRDNLFRKENTSRLGLSLEVEKSVGDILALTPQVNAGINPELSTLYASTVTEGRFRMASAAGDIDFDSKRLEMLKDVAATWESPTPAALAETSPAAEPFSTFSLHVSDVSFQLAKAALASGQWPEVEKIRIEEFVNAFDYGDPMPAMEERVAARIDQAAHPFLQQRNLVRIALRTAEAGRSSGTPLRLTLLLDSSGSMERPDRRETVRRAVATLVGLLGENDRITLVSFARQPRLVADAVPGDVANKLAETVATLPSEGGTNLEAALQLAFEKAREHHEAGAQNRIVLLTDGAANLGDAKAESLGACVERMRDAGIAFDAAGFGAEGLNDEILEALTRKGDGRYYLLDRPEDAEETFAKQIAGALRPAAKNVKVQVEFNPDRVKSYKLLGFEKHLLATEDFRNDAVDAAEMAAAEAGVAVYQVEPNPGGEGDLGSVSVRFRDLENDEMIERRWALPYLASAPAAAQGGSASHLATVASQFAAKLAGGPLADVVDLGELASLAATLPDGPRVAELRSMIEQARAIEGTK